LPISLPLFSEALDINPPEQTAQWRLLAANETRSLKLNHSLARNSEDPTGLGGGHFLVRC
jgi:hypothetical protein